MPLKIIRNDITKVKADIIVDTANPMPVYGGGTDQAIYMAAGIEELLAERKKIGEIERGNIAVTPAFALNAKYLIHTVGPVWEGGQQGEFKILENCYVKSLEKCVELGCESIAFPLISTGVYGFPKDMALQIAVSVFSKFLLEHEIQIILVVFDKKSFQLSGKIVGEIDSYIDAHYVKRQRRSEYSRRTLSRSIECEPEWEEEYLEERMSCYCEEEDFEKGNVIQPLEASIMQAPMMSLEDELDNIGMSFHDKLFELIDGAGIDNKDVWKQANLDRKHFSKIQCDANYHPKKKTVMALCIALRLDLDEARDLMARADWAFSPSSKVDLIVQKAIIDKQYDKFQTF